MTYHLNSSFLFLNVISYNFLDCLHIDKCFLRSQNIIILLVLSQALKPICGWEKYKDIFFFMDYNKYQ